MLIRNKNETVAYLLERQFGDYKRTGNPIFWRAYQVSRAARVPVPEHLPGWLRHFPAHGDHADGHRRGTRTPRHRRRQVQAHPGC